MTPEQEKALREPFPAEEVGKLPRVTCKACRDSREKVCDKHRKQKCEACGNWITNGHIHLDYVGHAETTDRFLSVDPEWQWEPVAWTEDGRPAITQQGPNFVMWGRLTLCGVTRLGVGTAPANKDDVHKELIGDFLRNAGMRFGVALDLWRKSERAEAQVEHAEPEPVDPQPDPEPDAEPVIAYATPAQIKAIKAATKNLTDEQREALVDGNTVYGVELVKDGKILVTATQADDVLTSLKAAAVGQQEPVEVVASYTAAETEVF